MKPFGFLTTIIILVLFVPLLYAGDTGKFAGTVLDQTSGEPLAGANVIVEARWENDEEIKLDNPLGAATDLEGKYYILNVRPGFYTVSCEYIGYNQKKFTNVRVDVDKTTRMDFKLDQEIFEGEEITVIAYHPEEVEIDLTATKQVYNISDVQDIAGVTDINDILQLQADVVDDHFRGGRLGESTYILGGGAIVNPLDNRRAFRPIVTGLEQVEVYTSGFSAEYGNAQSGVVNMVTKEGTSKWQSRMEVSLTLPYYKTWQESPYDPNNLYFYDSLSVLTEWLKENPTQPGKPLYDAGYGFGPQYLRSPLYWGWPPPGPERLYQDSLEVAYLGQVLWYQAVRDIGLETNKNMDYRLDFTTGGPLNEKTHVFIAVRQNIINPVVPMPNPDLERQMMLNVSYRPVPEDKIKFSFIYDNNAYSTLGDFRRYLFDRTLNAKYNDNRSVQFTSEWEHIYNKSTYSEIIFSLLDLHQKTRLDLMEPGTFIEDWRNTNWTDYTMPSFHRIGRPEDDMGDQRTQTYNLNANVSRQVNDNNLLKSGVQFTYYDLSVDMHASMSTEGSYRKINFNKYPFEGAVYFQDKMEFSGMIANVGLRFDFYQLNTSYFNDTFSPLRSPDDKSSTKLFSRLQPRIGISFPVSSTSVFHLNYGTFTQRPNFNQLFYNQITTFNDIDVLGNPKLKPETTNSYDIGIVQGLPFGFRLDVSAYYKDVKDLVQSANYKSNIGETYRTYINRDYADIKGFHVSFEKITGNWQGYLRYNFESATGKSSNDLNAPVTYFENPDPVYGGSELPDPEDIYLDYDRKHKIIFNIRYRTDRGSGPEIFGLRLLGNISISSTIRYITGRPYTFDESGQGLKFNRRTPRERDWRMRLQKKLRISETTMTAYVEGFNLFNQRYFHYSRTFDDERETGRWHYNRDNILVYDQYVPYTTSQAIYLLRNEPRHFRIGAIFNF